MAGKYSNLYDSALVSLTLFPPALPAPVPLHRPGMRLQLKSPRARSAGSADSHGATVGHRPGVPGDPRDPRDPGSPGRSGAACTATRWALAAAGPNSDSYPPRHDLPPRRWVNHPREALL